MSSSISRTIPSAQLQKLQFLLGDFAGMETIYPPQSSGVTFKAILSGSWEACERFFKIDFYGEIPGFGVETFTAHVTYSDKQECYRMWIFAASQEDPLYMTGEFNQDSLVFLGDPTAMAIGMQRLKYTLTPVEHGAFELLGELWEPDGYAKYCSVVFRPE